MTFISYAQNFEDVMLWRALKHVDAGFYVDVGANDPTIDSVTRAFYDRGWRGINIEPSLELHGRLCADRPRDINLPIAVAETESKATFFEVATRGWSTLDADVAAAHQQSGQKVFRRQITVGTLDQVCNEYVEGPIHFLKVDVEGAEERVLRGLNLLVWRPWILIVESTFPNTEVSSYQEWEPIVLSANYLFAYFDGLNRYYVAAEYPELKASLSAPPNVFDKFILAEGHYFSFPLSASRAEQQLLAVQSEIQTLGERAWVAEERAKGAEQRTQVAEERAEAAEQKTQVAEERAEAAEQKTQLAEEKAEAAEQKTQVAEVRAQAAEHEMLVAEQGRRAAEQKVEAATERAQAVEVWTKEVEAWAQSAENWARTAEASAQAAEARVQIAEARAQVAEASVQIAEASAQTAEARVQIAEARAQVAEASVQTAEARARTAEADSRSNEERARAAESRAQMAEMEVFVIRRSSSWRITAPVRGAKTLFGRYAIGPASTVFAKRVRPGVRKVLLKALHYLQARPGLKFKAARLLDHFPKLKMRFAGFAHRHRPQEVQKANHFIRVDESPINNEAAIAVVEVSIIGQVESPTNNEVAIALAEVSAMSQVQVAIEDNSMCEVNIDVMQDGTDCSPVVRTIYQKIHDASVHAAARSKGDQSSGPSSS